MAPTQEKLLITSVLFLIIFALGYWLHQLEKPYPTSLLTLHKLLSLGLLVYLIRWAWKLGWSSPLPQIQLIIFLLAGFLWIATILSGGFLSLEKEWPRWFSMIHHILPYLTVLVSGWSLSRLLL